MLSDPPHAEILVGDVQGGSVDRCPRQRTDITLNFAAWGKSVPRDGRGTLELSSWIIVSKPAAFNECCAVAWA